MGKEGQNREQGFGVELVRSSISRLLCSFVTPFGSSNCFGNITGKERTKLTKAASIS